MQRVTQHVSGDLSEIEHFRKTCVSWHAAYDAWLAINAPPVCVAGNAGVRCEQLEDTLSSSSGGSGSSGVWRQHPSPLTETALLASMCDEQYLGEPLDSTTPITKQLLPRMPEQRMTVRGAMAFVDAAFRVWHAAGGATLVDSVRAHMSKGADAQQHALEHCVAALLGSANGGGVDGWQRCVIELLLRQVRIEEERVRHVAGGGGGGANRYDAQRACVSSCGVLVDALRTVLAALAAKFDVSRLLRQTYDVARYGEATLSHGQMLMQLLEVARENNLDSVTLVDYESMIRRGARDEQSQVYYLKK